mgnify:CR=1 FL=1
MQSHHIGFHCQQIGYQPIHIQHGCLRIHQTHIIRYQFHTYNESHSWATPFLVEGVPPTVHILKD